MVRFNIIIIVLLALILLNMTIRIIIIISSTPINNNTLRFGLLTKIVNMAVIVRVLSWPVRVRTHLLGVVIAIAAQAVPSGRVDGHRAQTRIQCAIAAQVV